jgi:hypothetical protein
VARIIDRRLLGAVNQFNVSGSENAGGGGGGSGIIINNNVDGYILKATGVSNTIEGIPTFLSSSAGLTVKDGNMYISGSGNYLNLHGTSHTGEQVKFQVEISGGLLKIVDQ